MQRQHNAKLGKWTDFLPQSLATELGAHTHILWVQFLFLWTSIHFCWFNFIFNFNSRLHSKSDPLGSRGSEGEYLYFRFISNWPNKQILKSHKTSRQNRRSKQNCSRLRWPVVDNSISPSLHNGVMRYIWFVFGFVDDKNNSLGLEMRFPLASRFTPHIASRWWITNLMCNNEIQLDVFANRNFHVPAINSSCVRQSTGRLNLYSFSFKNSAIRGRKIETYNQPQFSDSMGEISFFYFYFVHSALTRRKSKWKR